MRILLGNRIAVTWLLVAAAAGILSCESEGPTEPQVVLQLLPATPNLIVGSTIRLEPRTSAGDAIAGAIKWSTSAPAIVSVDAVGRIAGIATGTAVIRAYAGGSVGETTVTVAGAPSTLATNVNTTCGITTANELYCWGANEAGQTGGGDQQTPILAPRKVGGNQVFTSVSVSTRHACGTTTSGVYCWGDNTFGQIGDGTSENFRLTPTPVTGGASFASVAVASTLRRTGGFNQCLELAVCMGRTCALSSDGTMSCWGMDVHTPAPIPLTVKFRMIDMSFYLTCGLDRASVPYCIGGDPFIPFRPPPVNPIAPEPVRPGLQFQGLSHGQGHTCGLDFDGDAHCWGANEAGELGAPSTDLCLIALGVYSKCRGDVVKVPTAYKFIALSVGNGTSLRIASPNSHTCAVTTSLQIACWGNNASGQLGNGSTQSTQTPTLVTGNLRFISVTAGTAHPCGVTG